MEKQGIYVVNEERLSPEQKEFCRNYFTSIISGNLVPLMLRQSVKIPFLPDEYVYMGVKMENNSQNTSHFAIIQVPVSDSCPRFVVLPSEKGKIEIIFVEDIIRLHLNDIFFMFKYDKISAHNFKITRDADLAIDDEVSKRFAEKIAKSLIKREHGRAVSLYYNKKMPEDLLDILVKKLKFSSVQQIEAGGPYFMMGDLMHFPKVNPSLEYEKKKPIPHPHLTPMESIFEGIREKDALLYFPYHEFRYVIDFLREAAIDPCVESISITLYRTADQSKIIKALKNAARNGKKVNAFIELKASFDESNNVGITMELKEAGVHVHHFLEGLKVHSKLILIERNENGVRKGYVYIGTGNLNESTATLYTDFGLLSYNQSFVKDARKVFDFICTPHFSGKFKHLLVSPFNLRKSIEEMLETEIDSAKKGKEAWFYGKFNGLTDEKIIKLLYKASTAGVKIRLIVRGECCLRSQVKDLSENIEVHSIVDKYLEHARVIISCNKSEPVAYIASADLMNRNLDERVEIAVPILEKSSIKMVLDIFDIQWNDNVKSRNLSNSDKNEYIRNDLTPMRSQDEIYDYLLKQKG
jgi:polyphosphate kinase